MASTDSSVVLSFEPGSGKVLRDTDDEENIDATDDTNTSIVLPDNGRVRMKPNISVDHRVDTLPSSDETLVDLNRTHGRELRNRQASLELIGDPCPVQLRAVGMFDNRFLVATSDTQLKMRLKHSDETDSSAVFWKFVYQTRNDKIVCAFLSVKNTDRYVVAATSDFKVGLKQLTGQAGSKTYYPEHCCRFYLDESARSYLKPWIHRDRFVAYDRLGDLFLSVDLASFEISAVSGSVLRRNSSNDLTDVDVARELDGNDVLMATHEQ
ncbi:hypothetical protein BaRGS_00008766 [Batillaria attramentaria]|uniref:Uncharacterized protein n=1 Tax=Batillaria attramentaria TaxID=370345 RepID=A0ABD0LKS3_9CAEN